MGLNSKLERVTNSKSISARTTPAEFFARENILYVHGEQESLKKPQK